MHSDSSDEENLELLKEAQDNDFLSDSLFKDQREQLDSVPKLSNKEIFKSLRKTKDENDQFNVLGLTPGFQNYVAKQLSIILDEKLKKITKPEFSNEKSTHQATVCGGVKLFSSSKNFVEKTGVETNVNKKSLKSSRNYRRNLKELLVTEEAIKSVAVSGELILQKEGLTHWSSRTKGKVYCYKKNDEGQLMLIE